MHPLFTEVKILEEQIEALIEKFRAQEHDAVDHHAAACAKDHFKTATMWLTKSLFPNGGGR